MVSHESRKNLKNSDKFGAMDVSFICVPLVCRDGPASKTPAKVSFCERA